MTSPARKEPSVNELKKRLSDATLRWRDAELKVHELEELRKQKLPAIPEKLDFRNITRPGGITIVNIFIEHTTCPWLLFGQSYLRQGQSHNQGRWRLGAYLEGATDFEHDSAHAIDIPLIGVEIENAEYGVTTLKAWIDPTPRYSEHFNVPPKGYDPRKHPEAEKCSVCKGKKGEDDEPHIIVPEGFYCSPENPELFKQLRGLQVEITIGSEAGASIKHWLKWEAKLEP
jgi:hypothetical protein